MADFNEEDGFDKYSETQSLSKTLDDLMGKIDPKGDKLVFQTEIRKAWEKVSGESTLAHTAAVFAREDVMYIWMDSAIWANEINLMKDLYLPKINELLSYSKIKEIRVSANKERKPLKSF